MSSTQNFKTKELIPARIGPVARDKAPTWEHEEDVLACPQAVRPLPVQRHGDKHEALRSVAYPNISVVYTV